jgi:type II secretory pathway component PulK
MRLNKRLKNDSGSILLSVLWMVMILAAFAVTMSRQASMEIALTKHTIGKLQSKYQAWAGIMYAIKRIQLDSHNPTTKEWDSLYACGIALNDDEALKDVFSNRSEDKDYFQVGYDSFLDEDSTQNIQPGLTDEERFFNINALTRDNQSAFLNLLDSLGVSESESETIATAIMDWKDEDDIAVVGNNQKENEYYQSRVQNFPMKNRVFDSLEELRLLGMTDAVFKKVSPYLTVHPVQGNLRINFDTASPFILKAFARSVSGLSQGNDREDADSLVEKMLEYRKGDDGQEMTADDKIIELNDLPLNAEEKILVLMMNQYRTKQSEYLRVISQGVSVRNNIKTTLEAVIRRKDLAIVEWKRN